MTVTGIIAEYNPLHNGHVYHIKKAKELTGAEFIVAVMSGNFVQRGEPAIFDKWLRTRMALNAGADLVVELPVPFALSSAEGFAGGGIKLLERMGVINCLFFGSESGCIDDLTAAAGVLETEPDEFKDDLKKHLDSGHSYPAAISKAFPDTAFTPNNILALEYIKSLIRLNSSIQPVTIQRQGSDYNETSLKGCFSSATAVRKAIHDNLPFYEAVPYPELIKKATDEGRGPVSAEDLFENLCYQIRKIGAQGLIRYPFVKEGLENRIYKYFTIFSKYSDALNAVTTRRYPMTRIGRTLMCLYLGLTSELQQSFFETGPSYIRVLGMKESARRLVRDIKNTSDIPISNRLIEFARHDNPAIRDLAAFEAKSTDLYVTHFTFGHRQTAQDFTTNPVILP